MIKSSNSLEKNLAQTSFAGSLRADIFWGIKTIETIEDNGKTVPLTILTGFLGAGKTSSSSHEMTPLPGIGS
jgi:hypothetical protein